MVLRPGRLLLHIFDLDLLAGHALRQGGGHEAVEVAVEDIAGGGGSDPGAQVLDQLIGLEDCLYMTASGPRWFSTPPPSIDRPFG